MKNLFVVLMGALPLLSCSSGGGGGTAGVPLLNEETKQQITLITQDMGVVERSVAIASGQTPSRDFVSEKAAAFAPKIKANCAIDLDDKDSKLNQPTYSIAEKVGPTNKPCPITYLKSYTQNREDNFLDRSLLIQFKARNEAVAAELGIRRVDIEGSMTEEFVAIPDSESDLEPRVQANFSKNEIDSLRLGLIKVGVSFAAKGTFKTGYEIIKTLTFTAPQGVVQFVQTRRGQLGAETTTYMVNGAGFTEKDLVRFVGPELFYFPEGPR